MDNDSVIQLLKYNLNDKIINHSIFRGLLSIDIMASSILDMVSLLRANEKLDFSMLIDISGVDYSDFTDDLPVNSRFGVIYIFYSFANDLRIKVRAFIPDDKPEIDSIYGEFKGADWTEREIYDMYGISFRGHPNLERILMPDYYKHHPLRKDYPLRGLGERTNFPKYNIYDKLNRE